MKKIIRDIEQGLPCNRVMATCFEDKVLSCVHLETQSSIEVEVCGKDTANDDEAKQYVSRFFFSFPDTEEPTTHLLQRMEDPNQCKVPPTRCQKEVISLEHQMATTISEVGFQVWSGAFLLCDYLLHHQSEVVNKVVLDLGAGPGLTSIVAAMFAHTVVCTDYLQDIVKLAHRNWGRNKELIPSKIKSNMLFKVLDWNAPSPFQDNLKIDHQKDREKSAYSISQDDVTLLKNVDTILAAEVVYDDELTDAFFTTIYHLLEQPPSKEVLISIEKRIVFTHSVCSPAYQRFRDNLEDLTSVDGGPVRFKVVQLDTDFPSCFEYQRVKELELWKVSSYFPSSQEENNISSLDSVR